MLYTNVSSVESIKNQIIPDFNLSSVNVKNMDRGFKLIETFLQRVDRLKLSASWVVVFDNYLSKINSEDLSVKFQFSAPIPLWISDKISCSLEMSLSNNNEVVLVPQIVFDMSSFSLLRIHGETTSNLDFPEIPQFELLKLMIIDTIGYYTNTDLTGKVFIFKSEIKFHI